MENAIQLLVFLVILVIWVIAAYKQQKKAGEAQRPGAPPGQPPRPTSGLDEIRRFLQEVTQPPKEETDEAASTMLAEGPRPGPPQPSRPGRPPSRRPAAAQPAPHPSQQRPSPAPGVLPGPLIVTRPPEPEPRLRPRPAPAVATEMDKPRPPARGMVARARATLGIDEARRQAARVVEQAREELATVRPVGLVQETSAERPEGYRSKAQATGRSLAEVLQSIKHPGARAIVLTELIGAPLSLRGPEPVSAHYL